MAAARSGAIDVRAVDVDRAAVEATGANASANGVEDRVTVEVVAPSGWDEPRRSDVVVANVGAPALRTLASALVAAVEKQGVILKPRPDTRIDQGDLVLIFALSGDIEEVERLLQVSADWF